MLRSTIILPHSSTLPFQFRNNPVDDVDVRNLRRLVILIAESSEEAFVGSPDVLLLRVGKLQQRSGTRNGERHQILNQYVLALKVREAGDFSPALGAENMVEVVNGRERLAGHQIDQYAAAAVQIASP